MADVEMSDAPVAAKKADGGTSKGADGKKKFEVKKVCCWNMPTQRGPKNTDWGSGTLFLYGLGISSSTTVPSVEITSWISVSLSCYPSDEKLLTPTRHRVPSESSVSHERGVHRRMGNMQCKTSIPQTNVVSSDKTNAFSSMLSTSIAFPDG